MEKLFVIRCNHCNFKIFTSGIKSDLEEQGLLKREVKKSCRTCGGARKFRCLKCGTPSKMLRIRKNQ